MKYGGLSFFYTSTCLSMISSGLAHFGEDGDDDDGDDGGLFGRRLVLPEIFDRKIVAAVLQEWFKTINDLPSGIRQAVELVSSA
jgi:hypothetical protein